MAYDPQLHHRRSIRLKGHDYAHNGAYFVTICTESRLFLFGSIHNGTFAESLAGSMIRQAWEALPSEFPHVETDALVIMPNHLHGILWIAYPPSASALTSAQPVAGTADGSLSRVLQSFKSRSTNEYIAAVKAGRLPPFDRRIWQRNYFEHVVRSEGSLDLIRNYILANPARWPDDVENPLGTGRDDHEAWMKALVEPDEHGRRQASPLREGRLP